MLKAYALCQECEGLQHCRMMLAMKCFFVVVVAVGFFLFLSCRDIQVSEGI